MQFQLFSCPRYQADFVKPLLIELYQYNILLRKRSGNYSVRANDSVS